MLYRLQIVGYMTIQFIVEMFTTYFLCNCYKLSSGKKS